MQEKSEKIVNLQERLKILRFKLNKSQDEMGELLGVTRNYIWMMESGEKPISRKMLFKIEQLEASLQQPAAAIEHAPRTSAPEVAEASRELEEINESSPGRFGTLRQIISDYHGSTRKTVNSALTDAAKAVSEKAEAAGLHQGPGSRRGRKAGAPNAGKVRPSRGTSARSKDTPSPPTRAPR